MLDKYFVYINGKFEKLALKELANRLSLPSEIRISKYSNELYAKVWSARLSTGLFGLAGCESGNKGPKGYNEVMLFIGDEGLNKVVELGFITCPVCHPENIWEFWNLIQDTVKKKYGIKTLEDFVDKRVLPFDARRVKWEEILQTTGKTPNRMYIPKGLAMDELAELQRRFEKIGFALSHVGYYNHNVPEKFTEYEILCKPAKP